MVAVEESVVLAASREVVGLALAVPASWKVRLAARQAWLELVVAKKVPLPEEVLEIVPVLCF